MLEPPRKRSPLAIAKRTDAAERTHVVLNDEHTGQIALASDPDEFQMREECPHRLGLPRSKDALKLGDFDVENSVELARLVYVHAHLRWPEASTTMPRTVVDRRRGPRAKHKGAVKQFGQRREVPRIGTDVGVARLLIAARTGRIRDAI